MSVLMTYGDSNTWGWDPRLGSSGRLPVCERWPNLLAGKTESRLVDDSLPGRRIPVNQAIPLFLSSVEVCPFERLVLMLGTNDWLEAVDKPEAIGRRWMPSLREMLKCHPDWREKVLLVAPPRARNMAERERNRLRSGFLETAEELKISWFDTLALQMKLQYDGIHLTAKDHERLACALAEALFG